MPIHIYVYTVHMYIAFHACAKSHPAFQLIGTELVGPATLHILALVPIKYDPFKNLFYVYNFKRCIGVCKSDVTYKPNKNTSVMATREAIGQTSAWFIRYVV